MADITQLSDEELISLANQNKPDITSLSDEELLKLAGQQPKNPAFLPNYNKILNEQNIRPDSVQSLSQELSTRWNPLKNPFKAALQPAAIALKAAAIPFQRAEAGVANVGMEAQRGNLTPGSFFSAAAKGISGERQGQLGDLIRTTGFGEKVPMLGFKNLNEGLANVAGGAGSIPLFSGVASGLAKSGKYLSGGAQKGLEGVRNIVSGIKDVKNPIKFSQNVRESLFNKKAQMGKDFEQGLNALSESKPNERVDLSDQFYMIKSAMKDQENNPGLAGEINSVVRKIKNPKLAGQVKDLIENPDNAKNLTLQESNDIKTAIQQSTSLSGKMGQGRFAQYKPGDLEMLDLVDEIKLAQAENFPELSKIRKPYAEYMNNYRQVKNMFKPGRLISKMKNGFGDDEIEAMVKHVLPDATSKEIRNYRNSLKSLNLLKWGAGIGATTIGGHKILNKIGGD